MSKMSKAKPYLPHANTLAANVCQYFRRLPDEQLSSKDIAIKWDCETGNVRHQLKLAVAAGLLSLDGSVYGAGEQIERVSVSAQPFVGAAATRVAQGRAPVIDIEAIEFDDDVHPSVGGGGNGPTLVERWTAKLKTMKVGQSFAVSREQRFTLQTAITQLRKQGGPVTYISRKKGDQLRVFCQPAQTQEAE